MEMGALYHFCIAIRYSLVAVVGVYLEKERQTIRRAPAVDQAYGDASPGFNHTGETA